MDHYRDKKVASLYPLPIILLQAAPSPQLGSGLLWGGIVICLLLSSASIGLHLIKPGKTKKRRGSQESSVNKALADYINLAITQRTMILEQDILSLKEKVKSSSQAMHSLDLRIDTLSKRLSDITCKLHQELPVSTSQYTPSLDRLSQEDPILLSLTDQTKIAERISTSSDQRSQVIPVSGAELISGGMTQDNVPSKLEEFALAIELNKSLVIRNQSDAELNITNDSEDALVRREPGHMTQLEEVNGGGSYYRLTDGDHSWLFPTPLTLRTIARNQPSKGLFRYENEPISVPRIKQPAEIRPTSERRWQVLEMGTITVPNDR